MTKLSQQAWQQVQPLRTKIRQHPFNQALQEGSLSRTIFYYYIEQDGYYLQDYARAHALIASRIATPFSELFLQFAQATVAVEQDTVHQHFKSQPDYQQTGRRSLATLAYTQYLLSTCTLEPVAVSVAAILPCCWIYQEVGQYIIQYAGDDNPYRQWIDTYASDEFATVTQQIIAVFDCLADQASTVVHQAMLQAFYTSTCLEWQFWQDAYNVQHFDGF
jgi:thiaminase/transcriptional activator TenA